MPHNLNAEFEAGRLARCNGALASTCPYFASSPCGDAWQAGFAFEGPILDPRHSHRLVILPHRMTVERVTNGRGYRINVEGRDMTQEGRPKVKRSLRLEHGKGDVPNVILEG